jgi:hypothetical protein
MSPAAARRSQAALLAGHSPRPMARRTNLAHSPTVGIVTRQVITQPRLAARRLTWPLTLTFLGLLALGGCSAPATTTAPALAAIAPNPQNLPAILGPVTGTGSRTFTISGRRSLSYDLSCAGAGLTWLRTLPDTGAFAVNCGGGTFGGTYLAHAPHEGQMITVRINAARGTRWALRVDGSPVARSGRKPTA